MYCLDASEVLEFLAPTTLCAKRRDEFPFATDIALAALFAPTGPGHIYVMPSHAQEVPSVLRAWSDRLQSLSAVLREVRQSAEALLHGLSINTGASKEQLCTEWITFIKRNFHKLFALLRRPNASVFQSYTELVTEGRLTVPTAKSLGISDWEYTQNVDRSRRLANALNAIEPSPRRRSANFADAIAIDAILDLNQRLAPDYLCILFTQSEKIWTALSRVREELPNDQMLALPAIQHTGSCAIQLLRKGGFHDFQYSDKELSELTEEYERSKTLDDLRDRLKQCAKRRENRDDSDARELAIELEEELNYFETALIEWRNLSLAKSLITTADKDNFISEIVPQFSGGNTAEFSSILDINIMDAYREIERLRRTIVITFQTTPSREFTLDYSRLNNSTVLYDSARHTYPYDHVFTSPAIQQDLNKLKGLLDERSQDPTGELTQQHMLHIERAYDDSPEYYLLVAYIFSSSGQWLQACDAASVGLEKIENSTEKMDNESKWLVPKCELMVAKAAASRRLALCHVDLRHLLTVRLADVAKTCSDALRIRESHRKLLATERSMFVVRDPRCLRELGVVCMVSAELELSIPIPNADQDGHVLQDLHEMDYFRLGVSFSEEALPFTIDAIQRAFIINNIAYGRARLAKTQDDIMGLAPLVRQLEEFSESQIEQFLDTRAYYKWRLAEWLSGSEKADCLSEARCLIEGAAELVDSNDRYSAALISKHRRLIGNELT